MTIISFLAAENTSAVERIRYDEITQILGSFKNYRYGAVNIYRVTKFEELNDIIKTESKEKNAAVDETKVNEIKQRLDPAIVKAIVDGAKAGKTKDNIVDEMLNYGMKLPDDADIEAIYLFEVNKITSSINTKSRAYYVITTKPRRLDVIPDTIIGMVAVEDEEDIVNEMITALKMPSQELIFSNAALLDYNIDVNKYGVSNVYELLHKYFLQKNYENMTLVAKSINSEEQIYQKTNGNTKLLASDSISTRDIQKFLQISEGMPEKYPYNKLYELTVGPDLIRFIKYPEPVIKGKKASQIVAASEAVAGQPVLNPDGTPMVNADGTPVLSPAAPVDASKTPKKRIDVFSNTELPQYGVELKYGADEINYASYWSERLSLNAIWQNVKLGIILPTCGWSSLSNKAFEQERKLTYGGVGVNGSLDMPLRILPKTGIFSISGAYVFGDAKEAPYKDRTIDENYVTTDFDVDYFVRGNAQLHYTFGVVVDEDYWIRLGIGGTLYSMEKWRYEQIPTEAGDPLKFGFKKWTAETVGGISGRIDFMVTSMTTPIGGRVQYFDESIYANLWLQIPVIENQLSVKLDMRGYAAAFRKDPREWENRSVFTPTLRFIYVF